MSDQNLYVGPPKWANSSVEKEYGYANAVTGEILVTMKSPVANQSRIGANVALLVDTDGKYLVDTDGKFLTVNI